MTAPVPESTLLASELQSVVLRLRRKLRSQGPATELSEAQRSVLRQLRRAQSLGQPLTVTELARGEGVRPQSMSIIVRSLEELGLVSRSPDPQDGRRSLLSLTAAGQQVITASLEARTHWLHQTITSRLSPAEQSALATALPLLERLLDS